MWLIMDKNPTDMTIMWHRNSDDREASSLGKNNYQVQ